MKDRLTVGELLAALAGKDPHTEVAVWLPGSIVYLTGMLPIRTDGKVLIEGNLMPGSALDEFATPEVCAAFAKGEDTRRMRDGN